jgi:glutamate-5-semialdehyde dehydrogenase
VSNEHHTEPRQASDAACASIGASTGANAGVTAVARRAREASRLCAIIPTERKNAVISGLADAVEAGIAVIMMMNRKDVAAATAAGLPEAKLARLRLTDKAIASAAEGLRQVASLPDPVGVATLERTLPSGLRVRRERTPLGVVVMIYEARPLVTLDAFALCFKSGNACILKGGSEAAESNGTLGKFIEAVLTGCGMPTDACQVLHRATRDEAMALTREASSIDLVIPRGGAELVNAVRSHSLVPVIAHDRGVCHVFVDAQADLAMATSICLTGKTSAPAACNALECVLVHRDVASTFIPAMVRTYAQAGVAVRGDAEVRALAPSVEAADEAEGGDFGREYLGLTVAMRVVEGMDQAIAHIHRYGSGHTEAIVTRDERAAAWFTSRVTASCVVVNASTRFNDGFQLGLGAEIGISTQKLHAYGPMGLEELTTQRWIVRGEGQTR